MNTTFKFVGDYITSYFILSGICHKGNNNPNSVQNLMSHIIQLVFFYPSEIIMIISI